MKATHATDITPDGRLEKLVEELATCIAQVDAAAPAPDRDDEYEATAERVMTLEREVRAVAPAASEATRCSLRRTYGDEMGYVDDLL